MPTSSPYRKVPLTKYGDGTLIATVSSSSTLTDSEVDDLLFYASYQLVAFDGEPATAFEKLETSLAQVVPAGEGGSADSLPLVGCLVASCAKAQYYSSVLLAAPNLSIIHQAIEEQEAASLPVFESWEIEFALAVLPFAQHYNMAQAAKELELCVIAYPQNILALRTLFLMHYLTSNFAAMKTAMLGALQSYPCRGSMTAMLDKRDTMSPEEVSAQVDGLWLLEPHFAQMAAFASDEIGEKVEAKCRTDEVLSVVMKIRAQGVRVLDRGYTMSYLTHTLCHVYEHDPLKALVLIAETEELWATTNLLKAHVVWHRMLNYYNLGDMTTALSEYDSFLEKFVTPKTADVFNLSDGAAFLWRAALDGSISWTDDRIKECIAQWQHQSSQQKTGLVDGVPRLSQIPFFDVHFRCAQMMEVLGSSSGGGMEGEEGTMACGQENLAGEIKQLEQATDDAKEGRAVSLAFAQTTQLWIQRHRGSEQEAGAKARSAVSAMMTVNIHNPEVSNTMGGSNAQRGILVHTMCSFAAVNKKEDPESAKLVQEWFDMHFTTPYGATNPKYALVSKQLSVTE